MIWLAGLLLLFLSVLAIVPIDRRLWTRSNMLKIRSNKKNLVRNLELEELNKQSAIILKETHD
jgi:hypothetical protein